MLILIPLKISPGFFEENDKTDLNFIWKSKGPRITKTILRNNKVGELTRFDRETYKDTLKYAWSIDIQTKMSRQFNKGKNGLSNK